jgi:hypothetical protein
MTQRGSFGLVPKGCRFHSNDATIAMDLAVKGVKPGRDRHRARLAHDEYAPIGLRREPIVSDVSGNWSRRIPASTNSMACSRIDAHAERLAWDAARAAAVNSEIAGLTAGLSGRSINGTRSAWGRFICRFYAA